MNKTTTTHLVSAIFIITAFALPAADRGKDATKSRAQVKTYSSFDPPGSPDDAETFPPGALRFDSADLSQVLSVYQELSGRTMIHGTAHGTPMPNVKITLQSQTPLTRREALQALDTVLAANAVTMVLLGTKFVKAVPAAQARTEAAPIIELPRDQLPESSSFMTYIVEVKNNLPRQVAPALAPFSGIPGGNSIVAMDEAGIVVLRDYSANIRRMLQVLDRLEKAPAEQGK